jgi:ribose transport system permease protein
MAAVTLLLLAGLISPGFLAGGHLRSMAVLAAFIGIVAIGQTFVIIGGGIRPLLWAVPLVLGAGAFVGVVNGLGVAAIGVPPLIMTLAVNIILQGAILLLTRGAPTAPAPPAIQFMAVGRIDGIPAVLGVWMILTVIATLLLSKTAFGRHLYALGDSFTVAEFSGVPTLRTTVLTYTISGFTAALAGMLLAGYSGQAYFGMGDPYLFSSIAGVAIGGVSITGGSGHYLGVVAGAFFLTILTGFLPALNLSSGAIKIAYGGVILVAVFLASDALKNRRSQWHSAAD